MAAFVSGRVVLCGGEQRQPYSGFEVLPQNFVYSFTPDDTTGIWKAMPATGSVHPGLVSPAFIAWDAKILIFGGVANPRESLMPTNVLSTLSPDGHYSRVTPECEYSQIVSLSLVL